MEKKNSYVAPNVELILYSTQDIVRTSGEPDGVNKETGGEWPGNWSSFSD